MTDRIIVQTEFEPLKMLKMESSEARKYLITNYFVPIAHLMWETLAGSYITLHIVRTPLYFNCAINIGDLRGTGILYFNRIRLDGGNTLGYEHRAFGKIINQEDMKKALAHAFPMITVRDSMEIENHPLVATVYRTDDLRYHINVLVKTEESYRIGSQLCQAPNRESAIRLHQDYARLYNGITGEWIGLCDDPDCESCKRIEEDGLKANALGV